MKSSQGRNGGTKKSSLQLLLKEQYRIENALNNIMAAIEKGIVNNTTQKRMKELEERLEELERLILIEKSKQKVLFSEKEVREYYEQALRTKPQMLINCLVQKIIWFDDYIEIYFNNPTVTSSDNDRGFLFCVVLIPVS